MSVHLSPESQAMTAPMGPWWVFRRAPIIVLRLTEPLELREVGETNL